MNKILCGKEYADAKTKELQAEINKIKDKLKLAIIQVGDNAASNVYIKNKCQKCEEFGINYELIKFEEEVLESDIIDTINKLNKDSNVTSILVQLPLPKHLNESKILNSIDYKKDVDGLSSANLGKLFNNEGITPCTPQGVIDILKYYQIPIEGKNVVVVGRSNLVGKPLMHLFLAENATVTVAHSKTNDLKNLTLQADILVVATGKGGLITEEMINSKTIIIDVGINRINNKLVGDVTKEAYQKALAYTPVPGGIGLVTIISLIKNIIRCYKNLN